MAAILKQTSFLKGKNRLVLSYKEISHYTEIRYEYFEDVLKDEAGYFYEPDPMYMGPRFIKRQRISWLGNNEISEALISLSNTKIISIENKEERILSFQEDKTSSMFEIEIDSDLLMDEKKSPITLIQMSTWDSISINDIEQ